MKKSLSFSHPFSRLFLSLFLSFFLFVFLIFFLSFSMGCVPSPQPPQPKEKFEEPKAIMSKENLFQAERFYFSGQPDEETFRWLAGEEVRVVINLRTDEEMEIFKEEKFDEPALLEELGMEYVHIPLGGKVGYTPDAVKEVANTISDHEERILIHCKSAARVSHLWVAYLVNFQDYSVEEAVDYGRKMKFSLPMEELLGFPLKIEKKI